MAEEGENKNIESLEHRIKAAEVRLEHLYSEEKRRKLELESREFHFTNKPKFDWTSIIIAAAVSGGIGFFFYYWATQHHGLR